MVLPLRYKPGVLVYPRMQILGHLAHFGHHITWVISSEKDCYVEVPQITGIRVCAVSYPPNFPRKSPLVNVAIQICHSIKRMKLILKLFREEQYDLLLVRDHPLTLLDGILAAYFIRRRYRIPFVFELPNPFEQRWQYTRIRKEFLYYLLARISAFVTRRLVYTADLIMPISDTLKKHLAEQGVSESRIMTLPGGTDTKIFSAQDGREIKEKFKLDNCWVIVYVGAMEKVRNLEVLIHALHKLKPQTANMRLLMVGDGDGRSNLEKLAEILGIKECVIFSGRVLQAQVPEFIAASDIGISPVPPFPFYRFSSPIKLFEYMAMAKPVIANDEILEHQNVLEKSGGGILVPFTPEAFANAMIELLNDPEQATEMGRRGRDWVTKNRSYEVLARQVEERYFELLK